MEFPTTNKRRMRAKLIFNPSAGAARSTPIEIVDVIHEMQAWKLVPEAYLVEPGCDLPGWSRMPSSRGSGCLWCAVVTAPFLPWPEPWLVHPPPWGLSPSARRITLPSAWASQMDIPAAIAILRTGRRIKVDVGMATCGNISTPFLEACSVGLASTLFPSVDDIQHGNLARIGDFLATLASFSASRDTSVAG